LTSQSSSGWLSVFGDPNAAVLTGTQNGITVSTVSTAVWTAFGPTGASDTNGEDVGNPTFVFNQTVTRSYIYNYSDLYSPGNENILLSGFTPGETGIRIDILGSRDAAGVSFATRLCDYICVDANGTTTIQDFDVKGNTANLATFTNRVADSSGQIKIGIFRPSPTDSNHEIGYLNAMRVTRTP